MLPTYLFREFNILGKQKRGAWSAFYARENTKTERDKAWLLSADTNNVHDFQAASPTAVFDILLPPYEEPRRPCTYFQVTPSGSPINVGDQVKLQVIAEPTEQLPYAVRYNGKKPTPSCQ